MTALRTAGMESAIEIKRPVEAVYGFFLDLERSVIATDPTVECVVKTTDGPLGPGDIPPSATGTWEGARADDAV